MHVGGAFGRWEVVLAGAAMQALGATAELAPTDHLVVEEKCWALLEGNPTGCRFEVCLKEGCVRRNQRRDL